MQMIKCNDKVVKFVKDPRDIKNILPNVEVAKFEIDENLVRTFRYMNGDVYTIEKSDRVFGTGAGDICQICNAGILTEYGGCYTCPNCGSQLKCGL